ncbi:NUDIX hydrolase [Motilimonas pumila]|uniref:NUDIX domain-containing protein n=1 Tax=Motilimonas pumila TaxID=2303987 RepID=A0A418YBS3_9GAMM|nr:NUDIX domain-containing protein [Motilimonas pumila]RJG41924.1 NUDIX domain-containing protein [Motilimonas pumila]
MIGSIEVCCFRLQQGQLQLLISQRKTEPFINQYALIGGGIAPQQDQHLDDTVNRCLQQKTQLQPHYLEQVSSQADPHRDPRGWSVCFLYLAVFRPQQKVHANCKWVNVYDLLNSPVKLAFDHKALVETALNRLLNKSQYSSLPVYFLGASFTLPELQQCFESILQTQLPKAAFRRRLNRPEIMLETGEKDHSQNRPAKLYAMAAPKQLYFFDQLMKGSPTKALT